MNRLVAVLGALIMLLGALPASAAGWSSNIAFTNQVVSSPTTGGGYPVPRSDFGSGY